MEGWLYESSVAQKTRFLAFHSLFILLGRETVAWPHQNHLNGYQATPLQIAHIFLCSVNWAKMVSIQIYWWNESRVISEPPVSFTKRIFSQGTPVRGVSDQSCFRGVREVPPHPGPNKGRKVLSSSGRWKVPHGRISSILKIFHWNVHFLAVSKWHVMKPDSLST